jgi:hypothetical protein
MVASRSNLADHEDIVTEIFAVESF